MRDEAQVRALYDRIVAAIEYAKTVGFQADDVLELLQAKLTLQWILEPAQARNAVIDVLERGLTGVEKVRAVRQKHNQAKLQ